MTSMPSTLRAFIDAAADYVARFIAEARHDARREKEIRDAEHRARIAELDARVGDFCAAINRRVDERLSSLKDGSPGRDGRDGQSISAEDVAPILRDLVTEAVRSIPAGKDGRDGVDGKDGEPGPRGERGFGLDDFDTDLIDEGRTMLLKFSRGETVEIHEIPLPVGPAGTNGRDGANGIDGERGPEGPKGALSVVMPWEDKVYYQGDAVSFDGGIFQACCDTGKTPDHSDWRCIVAPGRDGNDGKSFAVRGTWDPAAHYRALDVVQMNGASFVARTDDPGECPGEGWQLMAAQGKRGKPGEKGPVGIGARGLPGPTVVSISISDDGILVLTNGDGSEVECDLYPLLSKISR